MPRYVDGYVLPIPTRNIPAYRRLAKVACKVWLEHGALEYRECVGEDLAVPCGLPFPRALKLKRGETVVFAWVVYASRKQRDRVNAKVMQDRRLVDATKGRPMPFDIKRMIYGGFEVLVEA